MWFKHAQNAKQPIAAARPERAEALSPGRCPGLGASAPSGRAAYMGCLTFWACCFYGLLPFQGVLLWASWPFGRAAVNF